MSKCKNIQDRIDLLNSSQLQEDALITKHISHCASCKDYMDAVIAIHTNMKQMQELDAEDGLVDSTLASILSLQENSEEEISQQTKSKYWLKPQWAHALAASFMLISMIALFPYNSISDYGLFPTGMDAVIQQTENKPKESQTLNDGFTSPNDEEFEVEFMDVEIVEKTYAKYRSMPQSSVSNINKAKPQKPDLGNLNKELASAEFEPIDDNLESMDLLRDQISSELLESNHQNMTKNNLGYADGRIEKKEATAIGDSPIPVTVEEAIESQELDELEKVVSTGSRIRRTDLEEPAPVVSIDRELNSVSKRAEAKHKKSKLKSDKRTNELRQTNKGRIQPQAEGGKMPIEIFKPSFYDGKDINTQNLNINEFANDYLDQLQSLQGLSYKNQSGYWANTYLPGDYGMRRLNSYLEKQSLVYQDSFDLISANIQPFDAPINSAMEVYLSADHTSLENNQPTRMRLQVGLQASDRKGGQRGMMNIGVVIDIKNKSNYTKELKALLTNLLKSKQSGDQISLTFAGYNGGLKISAEDYRHGPIQVALEQFLHNKDEAHHVSLLEAIQIATNTTNNENDPQATLGNSLLLLISDRKNNEYIKQNQEIEATIHKNATQGILLSTISLVENSHQALIDWALAGQGHHRSLLSDADAIRVVNDELLASSKAVARALRLRIRLADGVKLINILGSHDLNEEQSQRVRDAENSIDQRLSKNLGITADRGKDEEGIQILIPAFYAGDTHVILLDVVASKAGPLADVSLRYKDLIHLKNSNSQKQLNLNQQNSGKGPLQLNVSKNLLAYHFSNTIKQASQLLSYKQKQQAVQKLDNLLSLYQSLQIHYPNWKDDKEINKDILLLQKYLKLIQNQSGNGKQFSYIVNSLQYISWRKTISNPI